ncbi:MAG TPA: hypothetical protein VI299_10500 [Polyangiales bacterium]
MRLLVAVVFASLSLTRLALAQTAPAESALGIAPASATAPESAPPPPAPVVRDEGDEAQRAYFARQLTLADSWIAFETSRDQRTRSAERAFYPLVLGVEAALAGAYAAGVTDVTDASRILAGVTAGVTLGAMVPTLLTKSRGARRAWFAGGAALFSAGAGATLIAAQGKGESDHSARWAGASIAVQGLMMLPVGFIPGFPDEADYEAYRALPSSERPEAAARLLARIDRFEQRAVAIAIGSMLASAVVLGVGAGFAEDRDQARTCGGLTLVPVLSMLTALAPRLLVRSRLDRYGFGEAPRKLPLNGW